MIFFAFSLPFNMVMCYNISVTTLVREVIILAIIHQFDKRSGLTYAYESFSYWDKEKQMTRAKRKLIGRVHPETGEIIPTDGRGRKSKIKIEETKEIDFEKLSLQLQMKIDSQEVLIRSLQEQLKKYEK